MANQAPSRSTMNRILSGAKTAVLSPAWRRFQVALLLIDFLMVAGAARGFAQGHDVRASVVLPAAVVSILTGTVRLAYARRGAR